jgi:uncharacterized membrane protein
MAMLSVRILLAALFLFAGTVHLLNPRLFLAIMPPYIPFHVPCVIISGIFELAGGIALLIPQPQVQFWAGCGLLLLLVAVFPANIYMVQANIRIHGFPSRSWMGWARLPLQPLIMLGVSWVTHIWPRTS